MPESIRKERLPTFIGFFQCVRHCVLDVYLSSHLIVFKDALIGGSERLKVFLFVSLFA